MFRYNIRTQLSGKHGIFILHWLVMFPGKLALIENGNLHMTYHILDRKWLKIVPFKEQSSPLSFLYEKALKY